jgi:hypothetical protein
MDKPNPGNDFETVAMKFFAKEGIVLSPDFPLDIGHLTKKKHCFDLGACDPKIIVECKCHRWTTGANVPSAKMSIWNEAMYYFYLAPRDYRKVLFVLHDKRRRVGESLLSYYRRTYNYLIPDGVEFLEWDDGTETSLRCRMSEMGVVVDMLQSFQLGQADQREADAAPQRWRTIT